MKANLSDRHYQFGTASVEFSLTVLVFLVLVMGIFELGRLVFAWNAAAEATRAGARMASLSTMNSALVGASMRKVLADLQDSHISVEYLPLGCNPDNCEVVKVSIVGYTISPLMIPAAVVPVPNSTTTVQRESLGVI
jgi:hypothetical protein